MDFKGTEGKWTVIDGKASGKQVISDSAPKNRMNVALCGGQRREENANLIAAAPELLEAIQETVKDLVAYQVNARHAEKINSRWEGCAEAVQPSIDKAREAIAKALGQ